MLDSVLHDERSAIDQCRKMISDCDDPALTSFAQDLLESHTALAVQIENALAEIKTKAGVLDDIIEGLEHQ